MEFTRYKRNRSREEERLRQQKAARRFLVLLLILAALLCSLAYVLFVKDHNLALEMPYDRGSSVFGMEQVSLDISTASGFAADLCVTTEDVALDGVSVTSGSAGLFDLENKTVLYAKSVHEKMYPASTTKIMTCLIALKYGSLDETITVGNECYNVESGSSVADIRPGDQLTLRELLYGLLINSGNDAAMSIAVAVAGSVDAFVEMMNTEAARLGATNTHFVNPHGLHDEDHYTTLYDLYLMFNEALKYEEFLTIINLHNYYITIPNIDGSSRDVTWESTNYYFLNEATPPGDVQVFGGKTGTTDEAGACLALYSKNKYGSPFISIIMHAGDKETLYSEMNELLSKINN